MLAPPRSAGATRLRASLPLSITESAAPRAVPARPSTDGGSADPGSAPDPGAASARAGEGACALTGGFSEARGGTAGIATCDGGFGGLGGAGVLGSDGTASAPASTAFTVEPTASVTSLTSSALTSSAEAGGAQAAPMEITPATKKAARNDRAGALPFLLAQLPITGAAFSCGLRALDTTQYLDGYIPDL